jgi:hypothetical protein
MLQHPRLRQTLALIAIALLCSLGIFALQRQSLKQLVQAASSQDLDSVKQQLETDKNHLVLWRYLPTFGFDNIAADLVYLQFLQYFGDTPARNVTDYRLSPDYFQIILDRDPYFLDAYLFLSTSTSFYARMPDRTVALITEKLPLLSPKLPPKSYYVWRYKGIDELLFLQDRDAASHSFVMTAEWAKVDGSSEALGVAKLSEEAAQSLSHDLDLVTAQIKTWEMVLSSHADRATEGLAIDRIRALGGEVVLDGRGEYQVILPSKKP